MTESTSRQHLDDATPGAAVQVWALPDSQWPDDYYWPFANPMWAVLGYLRLTPIDRTNRPFWRLKFAAYVSPAIIVAGLGPLVLPRDVALTIAGAYLGVQFADPYRKGIRRLAAILNEENERATSRISIRSIANRIGRGGLDIGISAAHRNAGVQIGVDRIRARWLEHRWNKIVINVAGYWEAEAPMSFSRRTSRPLSKIRLAWLGRAQIRLLERYALDRRWERRRLPVDMALARMGVRPPTHAVNDACNREVPGKYRAAETAPGAWGMYRHRSDLRPPDAKSGAGSSEDVPDGPIDAEASATGRPTLP